MSQLCGSPPPVPAPIDSRAPRASHRTRVPAPAEPVNVVPAVTRLGHPVPRPRGARSGRKMALWEDRSTPHPIVPFSKPRNHAEISGRIRGADPNDPPGAPQFGIRAGRRDRSEDSESLPGRGGVRPGPGPAHAPAKPLPGRDPPARPPSPSRHRADPGAGAEVLGRGRGNGAGGGDGVGQGGGDET